MNTQALLDRIPDHARPTWGPDLDDTVHRATVNGWTLDALAAEVNRGIGPNTGTGYVVNTLRRLASSNRSKTNEHATGTGPCQLGCDEGWTNSATRPGAVVPCPSCRPDTHRRVTERARLHAVGAPPWRIEQAMHDTPPGPVPHTWPMPTTS